MLRKETIPNAITVGRIIMTPAVAWLIFVPTFTARFVGFILFLIAAFSDLVDGNLARKHGWISPFGQLMDPIADKLLLFCTLIPFYIVSHRHVATDLMPFIGPLPLIVLIILIGRELLVTGIRSYVAKRGVVIPAGKEGKLKAVFQNIFIGTTGFWLALQSAAANNGWRQDGFWFHWQNFHGVVFLEVLLVALYLTVYSLVVYLMSWKKVIKGVREGV